MARNFISVINKIAREAERSQRASIREMERQRREGERQQRRNEREAKQSIIAQRSAYFASQESEAAARNSQIETQLDEFQRIVFSRIGFDPVSEFQRLFKTMDKAAINNDENLKIPEKPNLNQFLPERPSIFVRWLPSVAKDFQHRTEQAKAEFEEANRKREEQVWKRSDAIIAAKRDIDAHNNAILGLATSYATGDAKSVAEYFELALLLSKYPEPIQLESNAGYIPESRQLVVDVELPTIADAIPTVEKYRYIKKTNEITQSLRTEKSRSALYVDLISQIVVRSIYELCMADTQSAAETIVLNAYVSTMDPATGRPIRPCLISVRVSRELFLSFDLKHVDPVVCLKQLRASVSSQPSELLAVKPIVDLNMVDPRFIQETDIISTLDQRPNLMELTPSEFESLITNLFSEMGLETKLTQASRDGGVDCVAFDARPILGGKVVIQAKRYKNTVGVAAVRDLFGTLHNEGASKGILVTTSGFGKATYEFANGKPIELISGSNLLYLLKEHAGVDAKIEIPSDWVEPKIDA